MRRVLFSMTLVALLALPPAANAARRYASPTGSATSPGCPVAAPCTLEVAVNSAAEGDEVVVASGTYALTKRLTPQDDVEIQGDRDHAWPRIVGPANLKYGVLTLKGGAVEHVWIESAGKYEALVLDEGVADGVRLESANGDALTLYGSDSTVVRNAVVRSAGAVDSAALWLRDGSGANRIEIRNVTAMATAGTGNAIHCDVQNGAATVVNSIARGKGYDVDFTSGCSISYSNFRPAFATGVSAGVANQSAEPVFADNDYRPAAGSPTIDAGAFDAIVSSPDPDGRPRMLGAAPDIGAYEYAPPATGGGGTAAPELPDELKGVPLPKQGRSVVVAAARGTIRVRTPGNDHFVALEQAGRIPVGSVIDARHGRVRLATAIQGGDAVQAGLFWGSRFQTAQRRRGSGMTTLTLRGGAYCPSASLAVASRNGKRKRRRGLWARDHGGLYRTRGNDSVATARGTAWLTKDRCSGTLTRVTAGAVSVRDLRRHKRVLVKAGHSYFARSR